MTAVEVLATDDTVQRPDAQTLRWGTSQSGTDVVTDLDWDLSQLGMPTPLSRDLVRIAAGAYLLDRSVKRSSTYFSRRLELVVHVDQPEAFLSPAGQRVVDLLAWLTGDAWTLTPVAHNPSASSQAAVVEQRQSIMLLSGGLDSLCGAVIAFDRQQQTLHLGHRDQTGAVVRSQERLANSLTGLASSFTWQRLRLAPRISADHSTRTRSLMFMALATAAATARGSSEVVIPENGFTSLNLPLIPSRGGALSTKSTHPWTFLQVNTLLAELGIAVTARNPHAAQSKGEMLAAAAGVGLDGFSDLITDTLSCSKLDGGLGYEGGSPNVNCGLCIACLVRRGAFLGAGIPDPTEYLLDRVTARGRKKLLNARASDIWAVRSWGEKTPTVDDLIAAAPWPPGTDYDAHLNVVAKGRAELLGALDATI
ncbi:hypothetical protein JOF29_002811 [Kribbella aluminosa]|uniref:7-cyano-7-deazaguanine synthase in queuosine biosynthesis n=1 Tax=Kribbella aluminosa TaxID=416017 RepID=A0ABS4UJB4_9ACTN|nr:hypothetical protein [Kribbella aluminosa]MBP2351728.1 hypothetical protein [Kribbella aluminosa]